jgi:predicted permease
MNRWFQYLRHATRALLARPTFLVTAVLTLTLGIGAVAAIFTVYDSVLLKPLPYRNADRIVRVEREQPPIAHGPVSKPVFEDWRERSGDAFSAFAGFVGSTMNLTGAGDAERLNGYEVTPGFWRVFDSPMTLGRAFGEEEERSNERVIVIGYALWRDRFGAAPDVVGRDILLNGESYRVGGVAAADFGYPADAQFWMPTFLPANPAGRGTNFISVVARLSDGVDARQAQQRLAAVTAWQAQTFPDSDGGLVARVEPLQSLLTRDVRQPLTMLLAAAGLVLLIACANLANLMLARSQTRLHEFALRRALGAGRGALAREVLGEAAVIAAVGCAAGLLLAQPLVNVLMSLAPAALPLQAPPAVDLGVVATILLVAMLTLALFGLAPAWHSTHADPAYALRQGRATGPGRAAGRLRALLVSAEIALATTLLSGSGLLIESLRRLGEVDSGIQTRNVLTARLAMPVPARAPGEDFLAWMERVKSANGVRMDALLARVSALPGVASAALVDSLPVSGGGGANGAFNLIGGDIPKDRNIAEYRFVSPDYFVTLGIPVLAGHAFENRDGTERGIGTRVLVNRAFVDRFLGGEEAIGRQVGVFDEDLKTIVGVVGNTRQFGLDSETEPEIYFPARTFPSGELSLALKTDVDAAALAEPLRRALREAVPEMPVFTTRTMDEATRETTRLRRFNLTLMSAFAGVAVLLAAIGLYGVIAYSVGQRRREIAVRQSLGAGVADIHRLLLGSGLRMILPGLAAGIAGAVLLGHLIRSQLYGVGIADPLLLAGVASALALVAIAACMAPSLGAVRVPPLEALRNE